MIGKLGYLISLCRQATPISNEPVLRVPISNETLFFTSPRGANE
jgi:hypothetical protein